MSELTNIIRAKIATEGVISFAQFMEMALYQPRFGYYETGADRVGFEGDFYTSVSTGELFGQLLAFRMADWLEKLPADADGLRIVEAGAHDGRLAADIMGWLRQHRPELFERIHYWIVEPSSQRQAWQQEKLKEFGTQVRWVESLAGLVKNDSSARASEKAIDYSQVTRVSPHPGPLPRERENYSQTHARMADASGSMESELDRSTSSPRPSPPWHGGEGVRLAIAQEASLKTGGQLNGIMLSNELLDAMPVHRLGWDATGHQWFEWGVAVDGEKLVWAKMPVAASSQLLSSVQFPEALLQVLPDGYIIETCPVAEQWWREAAGVLGRGRLLTFDYGFTTEEMISPSRTKGTLRAYFRHQLSDDLLINPGEQDLTAHVNFSTIQAAGECAGLKTEGYLTQPQFLTKILSDAIKDEAFREWNASRTRQFQTLTHPQHLGRAFKVLVQRRGV